MLYGFAFSFVLTMIGFYRELPKAPDPFAAMMLPEKLSSMGSVFYIASVVTLLLLTVYIASKQLDYYYGQKTKREPTKFVGTGKNALFVNKVKQACPTDNKLDWILGFVGSLLFLLALLPAWWFIGLGVYSLLGASRCVVALRRFAYAQKLEREGETYPAWFEDLSNPELPKTGKGAGYRPRTVLAGWVLTQIVIAASALTMGLLLLTVFYGFPEIKKIVILVVMIAITGVLSSQLSKKLYRTARDSRYIQKVFFIAKEK
jgi:hypothetical protein